MLQMSYRFNTAAAIEGKMPLGLFNYMYSFTGPWQADQHATKALALDGWFVTLYSLQLTRTPLVLREEIRNAIPSTWEPKALARSVEVPAVRAAPCIQFHILCSQLLCVLCLL